MKSLIYGVGIRLIFGLLLIFSLVMLLRGHNLPGGGFIGGLIGALAFIVFSIGVGPAKTRQRFDFHPLPLLPLVSAVHSLRAFSAGLQGLNCLPVNGSLLVPRRQTKDFHCRPYCCLISVCT